VKKELSISLREWCNEFDAPLLEDDLRQAADTIECLQARVKVLEEALFPFSLFFKSEKHDLSPAKDHTIVASFLDQDTKLPLAELTIADFRKAAQEIGKTPDYTD
jgi:hypothetical protein